MDKQMLDQLEAELKEIIRIEQVMKYSLLTPGDVISLRALADNASPRSELLYALYLIVVERKETEANQWLQRCKRHANGLFLLKLSRVYALLGEKWHQESLSCLKRAAWRK
jgi:hypothetical protein